MLGISGKRFLIFGYLCRKTIVRNLTKDQAEGEESGPTVEVYLFIFLKFVSSMIPTISYDFTMDVSASTKK